MKANYEGIINNPEQVKELAQDTIKEIEVEKKKKEHTLHEALEALKKFTPDSKGAQGVATLLGLPDETFALLAPIYLAEVEKSLNTVNDQMIMVQTMNAAGIKAEDVEKEYLTICENIDKEMAEIPVCKRDFLKTLLSYTYNALSQANGIAKRHILIPIEYCRPDAKMPTYAHLTDAGMDIYLTEDITIHPGETKLIPTGIKVALPLGYELQVRPKSGRSLKSKLRIANTPGTIDAGYRDEIGIIADNIDPVIRYADMDENGRPCNILWGSDITLAKGEKIAQLVLSEVPKAVFYEVENVSTIENDGRSGGFGSTGDK